MPWHRPATTSTDGPVASAPDGPVGSAPTMPSGGVRATRSALGRSSAAPVSPSAPTGTRRRSQRRNVRTTPVGHIDAVCRVVVIDDEPDRVGLASGTLSNHPAQGEESFTVVRLADGEVLFEIVAASRTRDILATSPGNSLLAGLIDP
jgi:hypothetical protein